MYILTIYLLPIHRNLIENTVPSQAQGFFTAKSDHDG